MTPWCMAGDCISQKTWYGISQNDYQARRSLVFFLGGGKPGCLGVEATEVSGLFCAMSTVT